jgi:hypothetical protein
MLIDNRIAQTKTFINGKYPYFHQILLINRKGKINFIDKHRHGKFTTVFTRREMRYAVNP